MPAKATPQPEQPTEPKVISSKEYSLKQIEVQMLQVIIQQQNTLLSNFYSYIAIDRLATTVTPQTRFEPNEDMTKVTIVETEAPKAEQSAVGEVQS